MHRNGIAEIALLSSICLLTQASWGQNCGKERWSVKTGTDGGAGQVNLANPHETDISALIALPAPNPIPKTSRVSPTENTVFVVNATLTDYKLETDSDYHLVLQDDQGETMIAEIPSPTCVDAGSPFAHQIANARSEFDAQLSSTSSFQTANIPVRVTGVGFFDFYHGQHGVAPNVIELHPILDIQFNPPVTDDFVVSLATNSMHLHANSSETLALAATPLNGGNLPKVKFAVSGLPPGVTPQITPGDGGKANLVLSASPTVPAGIFPFTITGAANGHSHSQTVSMNISNAPETGEEGPAWEYRMITATSEQDVLDQASELGLDGWEMVSVVRLPGSPPAWKAFFKRIIKD